MKKIAVVASIVGGVLVVFTIFFLSNTFSTQTNFESSQKLLSKTWDSYKMKHISSDGRIIDYSQNAVTTSEGQSYAMLRAVWSDDQPAFDLVWNWTKHNLNRTSDDLSAWRWGQRADGTYGILADGGDNFATDADSDIALALLFASRKWNQPQYESEAKLILKDIWDQSTEEVNGKRYLLAGEWATNESEIVLNPSYFTPYSWRIFAFADPERDWQSLIAPAYEVLEQSGQITLHGQPGVGLPPNWIAINKVDSSLKEPSQQHLTTDYSYDAMRIPWRIAVDYLWFSDNRALAYLHSLSKLSDHYQTYGYYTSSYDHSGHPLTDYESPAMYSLSLAYFKFVKPDVGKKIYNEKIMVLYSSKTNDFEERLNYYDNNWLWFGIALYNENLPNLYQ